MELVEVNAVAAENSLYREKVAELRKRSLSIIIIMLFLCGFVDGKCGMVGSTLQCSVYGLKWLYYYVDSVQPMRHSGNEYICTECTILQVS